MSGIIPDVTDETMFAFTPDKAQEVFASLMTFPDVDPLRNVAIALALVMPKNQGVPGADGANILGTNVIVCSDDVNACVRRPGGTRPCDTELITVESMTGIVPDADPP